MIPKKRKPSHPGEILLEEFLKPMGITQMALAAHLKWPQPKVNEIIRGKRGITAESALYLAQSLGTTPEFWMNLQLNLDLWQASTDVPKVRRIA